MIRKIKMYKQENESQIKRILTSPGRSGRSKQEGGGFQTSE